MCNKSELPCNAKICPTCGIWIDSLGRCNCNSEPSRVNWNSGIVAAIVAGVLILSLFAAPVQAQDVQPTPTPSISTPPSIQYRVWLPLVSGGADVEAAGGWQALGS